MLKVKNERLIVKVFGYIILRCVGWLILWLGMMVLVGVWLSV